MRYRKYIYVAVFLAGKPVYRIGQRIEVSPKTEKQIVSVISSLIDKLDEHYQPIGKEYIAFEFELENIK